MERVIKTCNKHIFFQKASVSCISTSPKSCFKEQSVLTEISKTCHNLSGIALRGMSHRNNNLWQVASLQRKRPGCTEKHYEAASSMGREEEEKPKADTQQPVVTAHPAAKSIEYCAIVCLETAKRELDDPKRFSQKGIQFWFLASCFG